MLEWKCSRRKHNGHFLLHDDDASSYHYYSENFQNFSIKELKAESEEFSLSKPERSRISGEEKYHFLIMT